MSTLTLTLDDDLLAQVEAYAQRTGTDLSALFANAVRPIVASERERRPLSPEVTALLGCITLPPDFDYKDYLGDALSERERI
ncbi:DUF6364 family protein [Hymenobacter rubidus]|uniref:DUF6364 family protein n=1 Tax=Hymenobacter rubidus TaxID=1441626 RepID=UPI00191EC520|nr:DUF6364 family protein [Hymenobacter rubidus]